MSWIMLEYECPEHGRFDSLEPRSEAPDHKPCPICGRLSPWVISAPLGKVKIGEVTRGKSEPPPAHVMDTRALADGMPLHEFKATRSAERRKRSAMRLPRSVRGKLHI